MNSITERIRYLTRRQFLGSTCTGLGATALASLLNPRLLASGAAPNVLPHFAPRAKRVIWLTQSGAPSQLDLFDHKPQLSQRFDEDLPGSVRGAQRLTGMTANQTRFPIAPSIFKFQQHGRSGLWMSELLPNATALHLLGVDHTRLTYRHQGRDYRLTDVHGEVIKDLLI